MLRTPKLSHHAATQHHQLRQGNIQKMTKLEGLGFSAVLRRFHPTASNTEVGSMSKEGRTCNSLITMLMSVVLFSTVVANIDKKYQFLSPNLLSDLA